MIQKVSYSTDREGFQIDATMIKSGNQMSAFGAYHWTNNIARHQFERSPKFSEIYN